MDVRKIKEVFFKIPKYEIGWILGSNSGKRDMHINGEKTPTKIEEIRYIFLIFLIVPLFMV